MAFITDYCTFYELTDDIIAACQPFSCGNSDLDDFFSNDATRYAHFLMGKTYCFRLNGDPTNIVCSFTISNDSIRIYDLPRSRRDYMKSLTHHEKPLRRYPGVLIGRLGVNRDFAGQGIGSETLQFIKGWFFSSTNKTGCRFVIVDAVNEPQVISFITDSKSKEGDCDNPLCFFLCNYSLYFKLLLCLWMLIKNSKSIKQYAYE